MPNIQKEVPLTRIALLRVGAKTYFWRFEKSAQVHGFEKFVRLGNGLRRYEQSGEIDPRRLLQRYVRKKSSARVCGHVPPPDGPRWKEIGKKTENECERESFLPMRIFRFGSSVCVRGRRRWLPAFQMKRQRFANTLRGDCEPQETPRSRSAAAPLLRVPFPGAGIPRRRGGICAPRAAPALGKAACASTSRPRRRSAGGGAVKADAGARGAARRAGGPSAPARGSGVLEHTARPPSGVARARESEGTGSPAPRLLSATPCRAPKGRGKGGDLGAASGPASLYADGALAQRSLSSPRSARCCQPSPGVSAPPGRGGRAVRAGCRGRRRAGARGGNPRLVLPLPGSLSLSPRGAADWQQSSVTHSPRVHIPGEGSRKVINLHQATFPIT